MHNSKKCSNFAAETEDGAAGGAHAESFISKRKALYPAEHLGFSIYFDKSVYWRLFWSYGIWYFSNTRNKIGNERLQDMISPFVYVRRLSYSAWAYKLFVLVLRVYQSLVTVE